MQQLVPAPLARKSKRRYMYLLLIIACILSVMIIMYLHPNLTEVEAQERLNDTLESVFFDLEDNYLTQKLKENVTILVESIRPVKNGWKVNCIVTSVDLATPMFDLIWFLDNEELIYYDDVESILQDNLTELEPSKQEFTIYFEYTNGDYQIIIPEDMLNFVCGNLPQILPALLNTIYGG